MKKLDTREDASMVYKTIEGADHFFKNRLDDFNSAIDNHIKSCLINDENKIRKVKRDRRRRRKTKTNVEKRPERNQFPVKSLSFFENL